MPLLVDSYYLDVKFFPSEEFHPFIKDEADQRSGYALPYVRYEPGVVPACYQSILDCPALRFPKPRPFNLHISRLAPNYVRHNPRSHLQVLQLHSVQQHYAECH